MKNLNRKQKRCLSRIILSAVLLVVIRIMDPPGLWGLFYAIPYLIAGYDVLYDAGRNILHGQVFDENFLMCVATIGAFGCGEYPEGVMVMVLYQLGELFQSVAVGRSRDSISQMMSLCPDEARVLRDGKAEIVDPSEVEVGEIVELHPGEKAPLDGVVLTGESALDTSPLTGESVPRPLLPGEPVYSGCVNLSGVVSVRVTKCAEDSSAAKILEMMESATEKKAKTEQFITRFARIYTPAVCIAALLLAVVPSLISGQWQQWIYRAMTFLVISCPCALVISVPLTFFSGIGRASRSGILVKSGNDIERLADVTAFAFDKTGTLTCGSFRVTELRPVAISQQELLEKAAYAEHGSNHPIARSIVECWNRPLDRGRITAQTEHPGGGVTAQVDGKTILAGNHRFLTENGVQGVPDSTEGTTVFLAEDGVYLGEIRCEDTPKPEAEEALAALKQLGVKRLAMLTGDHKTVAQRIGNQLGLTEIHGNLLPGDKLKLLEQILDSNQNGTTAYVGDGINDAPVLRRADLGIAMGAMGTDAAIEAADVVLMDDDLGKLALAVRTAKRTIAIARQNIIFALGVKLLVLILGALGIANMWLAVFADVGVAVICILNACRLMVRSREQQNA